jgi:hypothetical protein
LISTTSGSARWITSATLRAWRTRTVSAPGFERSLRRSPAAARLSDALNVAKRASARGFAAAGGAIARTRPATASSAAGKRRDT